MESLLKFKCYKTGYAELSEKVTFFEIPAPKEVPFLKK